MSKHGSFQNHMYGNGTTGLVPEVGMGATEIHWTDREAYTVIEVSKSGKTITIQRDKATRTDGLGMTDSQSYSYEPDPEGHTRKVRLTKSGVWKVIGVGYTVVLGMRREYYDYSF